MDKYIWTKTYFISKELCDELICSFNNNKDNTAVCVDNKYNYDIMHIKDDIIIKSINVEITNELKKYNNELLQENMFIIHNEFYINKLIKNKGHRHLKYDFNIINGNEYKYLQFIIFLNDSDENVININNNYFKSKTGKLLLFPCGWCFPYEYLKTNNDNYFISGYITNRS